jgi:hypothetical protein
MPNLTKPSPASLKALFIGNSFTARNNLPLLVEHIATVAGKRFNHRLISVGGASLRRHWNNGEAGWEIDRGGYDFVVLQEQSTLPIKNPKRMHENVRLFDERIKKAGSQTALYLTWARASAPAAQDAITSAYTTIGQEVSAKVIPAGVAWQKFRATHVAPELYDRDGSHPTVAGSYLAACVAFGVLFGSSPARLSVDVTGLTAVDARMLQATAADVFP